MDYDLTFDCNGRVNSNTCLLNQNSLFLRGEIERVLSPQNLSENTLSGTSVELFNELISFKIIAQQLRNLAMHMEMNLKILCRFEELQTAFVKQKNYEYDFYHIRQAICKFLMCVRIYIYSIRRDTRLLKALKEDIEKDFDYLFHSIRRFLNRLRTIPDSLFYYAPSNLGNKSKQPEFHLYHMHLELRWQFLLLLYTKNMYLKYLLGNDPDELNNVLSMIVDDVVYISLKMFKRISLTDLREGTPYTCTCFYELCLLLQIFIDHMAQQLNTKTFWECVNDSIDKLWDTNHAENDHNLVQEELTTTNYALPCCKNPELFSIWIIHHLSLLYGYTVDGVYIESNSPRVRPNYEQLEKILKIYIYKGGKDGERTKIDEELKIMIPMLNVINWWQPRVSIICLLWDCFHKRLDAPFLLQMSGPWILSVEKKTAEDILKQVRERIESPEHFKECSYGMFLRLLGTFLIKYYNVHDTKYWNQIKSRIYSKFSKSKVLEYSINGVYNFLSLFLTLAITADTANVCSVMLDLLPSTSECKSEKDTKHDLIWKGKLTILLLYHDFKFNFDKVMDSLTDTINVISCRKDHDSRSMINNYIDVFNIILSASEKFEFGEHLLVGGWIDRYLSECPAKAAEHLISTLVNIFKKCIQLNEMQPGLDGVEKMIESFWYHVASRIRQIAIEPSLTCAFYEDLSQLAVLFTLEALRNPEIARKYKHSSMSLFQHFAASIVIKDVRIIRHYLSLILTRPDMISKLKAEVTNFDTILIQAWIKISILAQDENKNEISTLQDYVLHLDQIKQILSAPEDIHQFKNTSETNAPILVFIMCAMKSRSKLKTDQERLEYDTKWKQYFNHVEKWILAPVTEQSKDSQHVLWIYRCIGTLLLYTSPMLYSKNQTNPFKNILNKAVLVPVESPHSFVRHSAKRIFSMILLGMEALNVAADVTLKGIMRDLFNQYIPLLIVGTEINNLKVSDVLFKCFKDAKVDFVCLILETLASSFISILRKNEMPKHSYLVMALFQHLLKGGYANYVVESVVTICTPHIMNCYIKVNEHHPHRKNTIDFIINVVNNSYYMTNQSIRKKFDMAIVTAVQKSLMVNQYTAIEFMRAIAVRQPEIIQNISPHVERIFDDMEQNRHSNSDSIRYTWNRFKSSLLRNTGKSVW